MVGGGRYVEEADVVVVLGEGEGGVAEGGEELVAEAVGQGVDLVGDLDEDADVGAGQVADGLLVLAHGLLVLVLVQVALDGEGQVEDRLVPLERRQHVPLLLHLGSSLQQRPKQPVRPQLQVCVPRVRNAHTTNDTTRLHSTAGRAGVPM